MTTPPGSTFAKIYESIRDQIASEINSGVYPAGALLPSIREIMQRWEVSTTTARRVLDELAAAGYARKEGTRGHISTGVQAGGAATPGETRRAVQASTPGRLSVRPSHTIPVGGTITLDARAKVTDLDVRAEPPPADVVLALRLTDPAEPVTVRRRLLADSDGTSVELRTSYMTADVAEGTPLGDKELISESWPEALAGALGREVHLAASHVTARHPLHDEVPALVVAADSPILVREDVYHDDKGTPVDFTRTVWPGNTTRLAVS